MTEKYLKDNAYMWDPTNDLNNLRQEADESLGFMLSDILDFYQQVKESTDDTLPMDTFVVDLSLPKLIEVLD